ncbi:MAG: diaminopimelate decarboxylase [Chitinophagaceae bacterium]|nr:diaminopimelate decarboxylase [Chitinophagaceae bacterium]
MALSISPIQIQALAATYGTPLYIYDVDTITKQYQTLTHAFADTNATFFYACKANTNINILKHILSIGANIDCSSINEAKLALKAGFKGSQILYTSNGIHFSEIEEAVSMGVHINIDSLSNLEKFGEKYGHSYPVGLRLRPNIMAGGNLKISTGHTKSKFGIPIEQIDEIIRLKNTYHIHIQGLHIHTGSEIKDVDVFIKGSSVLFDLANRFDELIYLDLGGGFKVPYKEGEEGTDMIKLGKEVTAAFNNFHQSYPKKLQVWFEPGKFLVSASGYFVTTVNVLKQNGETLIAGVNSGFNHLIRPMFYDAYHQITNISNPQGAPKNYMVTGNICETDTFATDRLLSEVREGDLLVFSNAGAYGFEMGSNYNARLLPAQVMIKSGMAHLIRKRDVFEDLLRNQIELD